MANFKKVALQAPFVTIEKGMVIQGVMTRKRAEVKGKLGVQNIVLVELTDDMKGPQGTKNVYKKGDTVSLPLKTSLADLFEYPEGTEFRVTCTGQVDTGKGNPAWTFDLEVAE